MASITHAPVKFTRNTASDLLRSSSNGLSGIPLKSLGGSRFGMKRREFTVTAKLRKRREYPWPSDPDPNVKGGILIHLSPFKPRKEKPKPVTLDFEKPLVALEKKINDVRKMAAETGLDFSDQITQLENKYHQALRDLYTHLTPIQRVNIARHPNRPTFLDHVFNITDKFVELHGDRAGYDDPAIVTGLGSIDGEKYMFIGQQKGRNTKESIKRNFGMPTPHGYRKALRMMNYADHHGFPIVTFIDTPGAFADLKSEELGQGESIAFNLRAMFGLKVPIVSIVIGEGGSGGALAIGCANKLLMLENAVFYVASPEACAAILWKSAKASPMAAEKLKITATELCKLQIADGIIPEPLGGAHADPAWTSQQIKLKIVETMNELKKMNTEELLKNRMLKFRKIGCGEDTPVPPELKKKQLDTKKKKQPLLAQSSSDEELEDKNAELKQLKIRKKQLYIKNKKQALVLHQMAEKKLELQFKKLRHHILKFKQSSSSTAEVSGFIPALNKTIDYLKKSVNYEYSRAAKDMGFADSLKVLREEFSEAKSGDQDLQRAILLKVEKIKDEFNQNLSKAPNYARLKEKLEMLKYLSRAREEVGVASGKQQVGEKFKEVLSRPDMVEKIESLRAEIAKSGSASAEDLDQELKEKIVRTKKEIEAELKNVIGFQVVKPKKDLTGSVPEIKTKLENLNEKISKKIEDVMSNSEIKDMVAALKEEVAKAGPNPDLATKEKITELGKQIRVSVSAAISSSGEKDELSEILKGLSSGNGSVRGDDNATSSEESRSEVSVGGFSS